jgi:hypothetical protein
MFTSDANNLYGTRNTYLFCTVYRIITSCKIFI